MTHEQINPSDSKEPMTGSGRAVDVVGALKRHWMKGLITLFVVVLLGTPIAWKKGKAVYRAEGVIYVSPHNLRNLDDDEEQQMQSNSQFREYMQQQAHTINRYDIVLPIVQGNAPGALYFRNKTENDRFATDRLRGALQIASVPDTYQMTVALEGSQSRGLAEIVNAVMENYIQVARREMFYDSDSRLKNLDEERNRLIDQINATVEQRDEVAQKLGTTLFNGGVINNYEKAAGDNMSALMDAHRQRIAAEASLGEGGSKADIEQGVQSQAAERADRDPALAAYRSALANRKAELVVKIEGLAPKHPARVAGEKDIAAIDAELDRATAEVKKLAAGNLQNVQRGKLAESADLEKRLTREADDIQARASGYMHDYQQAMGLGEELERLRKRLTATEDRISTLQLEVTAPGSVRIFSPAMTPQFPTAGGRKKLLLMVLAAAFVLAFVVPIVFDYLDPAVRTATELEAVLGLPVTGWLPRIHGHNGVAEEVLRLAVVVRRHVDELKSGALVISALKHGSGSSTISLGLGKALDMLGIRTLVVEVNPKTPDERYVEGAARPGYAQWIAGDASLDECIQPASALRPAHICTGKDANELALMARHKVRVLVEEARENFDLVLIDACPLPHSLITEEIIRDLDSVMLVSQAHIDSRKEIKAAMKTIERLRPRTFGSVINKVQAAPAAGKKISDTPAIRIA